MGSGSAPVHLDNFTDFQCPYCAQVHRVLIKLAQRYPTRVRLQHHDYPLESACNRKITASYHTHSCRAAYFARCAAQQGRFWDFASRVFDDQIALGHDDMIDHGRQLGLDLEALATCVTVPDTLQAVNDDVELAIRRKVSGTPTTFVTVRGQVVETVVGSRTEEWWEKHVEQAIDQANAAR